jgi:glycine/D-amino acid oxidase-like deaminating enzyme
MPIENSFHVDVMIIGGGAAGLAIAAVLSEFGLKVLLVEREEKLAVGPSSRNEGWAHAGPFHGAAIEDRERAIRVARRSLYGYEAIRHFAPQAVEDIDSRTFALIPSERVSEVEERWKEAQVRFSRVSRRMVPAPLNRRLLDSRVAYEVADISINTRILYEKLQWKIRSNGGQVITGFSIVDVVNKNQVVISSPTNPSLRAEVTASLFIHAIGPNLKAFFRDFFGCDLPIGFAVSHLMDVTPRVCQHAYFLVEKLGATIMHHNQGSIVGLAIEQTRIATPPAVAIPGKVEAIQRSAEQLIPGILTKHQYAIRPCIKVFWEQPGQHAGLLPAFGEPVPNHVFVIPGKMTEALYLADEVFRQVVWPKLELGELVALRPLDLMAS